jgi:hypothetical protein
MTNFTISMNGDDLNDEKKMKAFQDAMDAYYDEMEMYTKELAKELNVSFACASSIEYLRTRSRWTQELENDLIEMDKKGLPMPNMCDYGVTEETQENMQKLIDDIVE